MKKNILLDWRRSITKILPERQVLMRSDGYVKFFLLSTTNQIIIISAITSIASWCIFTLLSYIWGYNPLRAPWREAEKITSNYEEVLEATINMDHVVNLAGYVDHSNRDRVIKSHYIGCKNLSTILLNTKIKKFIQICLSN